MYMRDRSTSSRHVRRIKRVHWPWARERRPGPGAQVRARYRRRLAVIERTLMADAPYLSSKFTMFNQLTDGERPAGAERVTQASWPRPTYVAAILVLAAIVALCLTLSAQYHPVTCPGTAAAGTSASAQVRDLPCRAYPTAK